MNRQWLLPAYRKLMSDTKLWVEEMAEKMAEKMAAWEWVDA
jgi:hypothetical protein